MYSEPLYSGKELAVLLRPTLADIGDSSTASCERSVNKASVEYKLSSMFSLACGRVAIDEVLQYDWCV